MRAGAQCPGPHLALFSGVRGIGLLGNSFAGSCIAHPNRPRITPENCPYRSVVIGHLATRLDRYSPSCIATPPEVKVAVVLEVGRMYGRIDIVIIEGTGSVELLQYL
jgi:hypothetical protein